MLSASSRVRPSPGLRYPLEPRSPRRRRHPARRPDCPAHHPGGIPRDLGVVPRRRRAGLQLAHRRIGTVLGALRGLPGPLGVDRATRARRAGPPPSGACGGRVLRDRPPRTLGLIAGLRRLMTRPTGTQGAPDGHFGHVGIGFCNITRRRRPRNPGASNTRAGDGNRTRTVSLGIGTPRGAPPESRGLERPPAA